MTQRTKAEILLVVVTFIWGSTFVIVKEALNDASPIPFLALRFTVAGILLSFVLKSGSMDRRAVVPGLILGAFLFGGYVFQTSGLNYTTPSKAAFITGFSVILVPLIMLLQGARMNIANMAGALLGLTGLYFLVLPSGLSAVNRGDVLVLFGAISFALHIVLVGKYTLKFSFQHLVPLQILTVGAISITALPFDRSLKLHWTGGLVLALAVTSILATGFAFSVQNWAQKYTPPAHTALIFALEPVFAALTSRFLTGERLSGKVLLGCGLILGGMVVSELWGGSAPSPVEG
ncbi:MAG TPA: DMT family transporter [Terriglobia bacterium]|nr:DMT family transporter [Terriglobia bacterium]